MSSPTILIVEANPTVRQLLRNVLGREGFSVQFASDPDEARWVFDGYRSELALMIVDLMSGGFQFINSIPTLEPRIPVLFTTTNTERDLAAVAQQGFPYLAKPFEPRVLVDRMRRLFAARHA
jgi:DNA-binding response OmpR family regulator